MRRAGMVGAWLVVVALTTAMTWQIVNAADNQVNEESSPPLNVGGPLPDQPTVPTGVPTTATTTTTPSGGPSSSSSTPSNTSSSTPPSTAGQTVVIPTAAGTVTVKVSSGSVSYVSAVPLPGFAVEIDDAGPPRVRVEFESESARVEVRAEWENGQLDVEIDESD